MLNTHDILTTIPKSWNSCTTSELEAIAATILKNTLTSTKWTPVLLDDIRIEMFYLFTHIRTISLINPRLKVEEQYYECELVYTSIWEKIKENIKVKFGYEDYSHFNLYLWQISYWIENNMNWLLKDGELVTLTKFPYPILKLGLRGKKFHGPAALMQDFSWQRFRFAQDFMDDYLKQENSLLLMQKDKNKFSDNDIIKQCSHVDLSRAQFLATIFCSKSRYLDTDTHRICSGYIYVSNQFSDNAQYFRNFDVIMWQVIMLWWTGMMNYLSQTYKHLYKKQDLKSKAMRGFNPLNLYVCSTATMQKYLGLSEEKINNQLFHLTLQHMENMTVENEQVEKNNKK